MQMSILGTNSTILLRFDVVRLSMANVSYEDSLWREQFSDVVDNTLTTVSIQWHIIQWIWETMQI